MSSSNLLRQGGGLTSIVAGVLLFLDRILNLGGDPKYDKVLGLLLVLVVAHLILVFALVEAARVSRISGLPLGAFTTDDVPGGCWRNWASK